MYGSVRRRVGMRLSRRQAMGGFASIGVGATAAALIGCGGGSEEQETSSLVHKPEDTTKKATRGGIYQGSVNADTTSFEPIVIAQFTALTHSGYAYSRLLKYKVGNFEKRADGAVEPDAAESFEITDGGLQYTLKLRPNLQYDSRTPTNGRPMDSGDVKYSWDRFVAVGRQRADLAYSVNPQAPVQSVTTPGPRTVVFKLAFPYAPFVAALAYTWYLFILPEEADGKFEAKGDMRGTGAWYLAKYTPSVGFEYRRNPNWYNKDLPLLDGVDLATITEYAQGLAQFKAGNLWAYGVRQEDIVQTKRDVPALSLLKAAAYARVQPTIYFGLDQKGKGAGTPFFDERVRRALSMLIDRDLWIDTFFNVSKFQADGLQVDTRWNSHVFAGEEQFWVDPRGKDLGEGAKYFSHDPAEAKKLLRAAGYSAPIEADFTFITTNQYGANFPNQAEVFRQMFQEGDAFKLRGNNPPFNDFVSGYNRSNGNFAGIAMTALAAFPDIDSYLYTLFHTGGTLQTFPQGDPEIERLTERQRQETDPKRRAEVIKEFQRYAATKFYTIPFPGQALGFSLVQPWVGNRGVFNTWDGFASPQENDLYLWHEKEAKRP